jgi:metal-responsive CopG/Arc/MetJ family transcriptional regulator
LKILLIGLQIGRKKDFQRKKIVQLSITIDEKILDKVDIVSKQREQSRTSFICLAIIYALEKGLHLESRFDTEK